MLYTNLKHIIDTEEFSKIIGENENVVVICGRMGPLCIPVYRVAEELEAKYHHVKFYDMEYDNPESYFFHSLPEVHNLDEIPFTIFYRNGEAVNSVAGLKSKNQITEIIEKEYPLPVSA